GAPPVPTRTPHATERSRRKGLMRMALEKTALSIDELEAQYAAELPEREMLSLVTIIITNVLNNLSVDIQVKNNNVAVQVCAVINILNQNIGTNLTCDIRQ